MTTLTEILNDPEEHYPGNFDTSKRAVALLTGLCQDAATEIERLQAEILEQCRINGMSAEREDALKAEVDRLNKTVADEREACAKVCDVLAVHPEYASKVTKLAAMAIRARGNT